MRKKKFLAIGRFPCDDRNIFNEVEKAKTLIHLSSMLGKKQAERLVSQQDDKVLSSPLLAKEDVEQLLKKKKKILKLVYLYNSQTIFEICPADDLPGLPASSSNIIYVLNKLYMTGRKSTYNSQRKTWIQA